MKDKIATKIREIAEQMQQELNSNHNKQTKCENLVFMQGQIDGLLTALRCADDYDVFCTLHEETKHIIDKSIKYCSEAR